MSRVVLLVEGSFGKAVGALLAAHLPDVETHELLQSRQLLAGLVRSARFVGVALWRRYDEELDEVDAVCTRLGVPWSSACLDGTQLINGPLIRPDAGGPCHRCFRRRWAAHGSLREREDALDAVYRVDHRAGVQGYLPSVAAAAAYGLALDTFGSAEDRGRLRIADLVAHQFEETKVVRVHGCPRCGLNDGGIDRYVRTLKPALGALK